jgi:hypothetical protein
MINKPSEMNLQQHCCCLLFNDKKMPLELPFIHMMLSLLQCMAKLEKAESECKGLMDKWSIVENDKKSLKQVL